MSNAAIAHPPHHVEQDLIAFIRDKFITADGTGGILNAETPLFEDGLIDSINILALIGFVESRLGRRLDDAEIRMPSFRSVRAIVDAFFA